MVIVEQSLNVALAFADRAIFMEKGQVRFSGRSGTGWRRRRPRPSRLPRGRGRMIELLGVEISQQALLVGVVTGLTYAAFAAGFVLIYRSTGVLFAHGEMGAFGLALFVLLLVNYDVNWWLPSRWRSPVVHWPVRSSNCWW